MRGISLVAPTIVMALLASCDSADSGKSAVSKPSPTDDAPIATPASAKSPPVVRPKFVPSAKTPPPPRDLTAAQIAKLPRVSDEEQRRRTAFTRLSVSQKGDVMLWRAEENARRAQIAHDSGSPMKPVSHDEFLARAQEVLGEQREP